MEILNSCRCCSLCTAKIRYVSDFSCFAARRVLVTDKHFLWPEILLAYCVFFPYSLFPCQITHCWILHENQHTILSRSDARETNTSSARECLTFTPEYLVRKWRKRRPSNQYDFHSSVEWETEIDSDYFLYRTIWFTELQFKIKMIFKVSKTTRKIHAYLKFLAHSKEPDLYL